MMEVNFGLLKSEVIIDSGLINQHVDIARQLEKNTVYSGEVTKNGVERRSFRLRVSSDSPSPQCDVDLFKLFEKEQEVLLEVSQNGFIILYSSWGSDQYRVVISEGENLILDTYELNNKELIIVTPFKPGKYKMVDQGSGATTIVNVSSLKDSSGFVEKEKDVPIQVMIVKNKFVPKEIELIGDQPAVIHAAQKTRILLNPEASNQEESKGV